MNIRPAGNRDKCGKCGTRHGGNNHLCDVHGKVSQGCCETSCNPDDYVKVDGVLKLASRVDLAGYEMEPPYMFQDDGNGNYKAGQVKRFTKV